MRLRRLKALVIKESWQIIRDPSSILIAFVLPMLLLFIFGYGVSLDANVATIGIVGENRDDPKVRSLVQSFFHSSYFEIKQTGYFLPEVTPALIAGKVHGIIVVPSYFAEYTEKGFDPVPLMLITDASDPNTANLITNYVRGAWQHGQSMVQQDLRLNQMPPIEMQPRFWFNEELKSRNFLIPSSIAIILTIIGTLLTALVVAREWERGTMEAMMATPISQMEIILGKLIPYFLLGIGSMLVCTFFALYLFDVPLRGSFAALLLSSSIYLIAALSIGLLISTLTRNQFVAAQIALLTAFLPAFLLSGFIFEIKSMPIVIQVITYIVPARYFVSTLKTIFLAGDIWQVIIPNLCVILLIATVLLTITKFKTRKSLE